MAGYKSFGSEVLTADDVNEYLMRQAVIRVANASQLAGIPAPEAGMMAYREDNATTYRHDGTNWVAWLWDTGWVAIPPNSGSGSFRARCRNGEVEVRFDLTGMSSAASGAYTTFGTLPASIPAPSGLNARGTGFAVNSAVPVYVVTNGQIGWYNSSGAARTGVTGAVVYLVG